jgi:transcriptional regulator with XRE-family HTH domain
MEGTTTRDELPELLILCRSERNMSLADVAKAVRLSVPAIADIERGVSKPRRTTRLRIVNFLRKHGYFPKAEAAA